MVYSVDLRKKAVSLVEKGKSKTEVADTVSPVNKKIIKIAQVTS